MGEVVAEANFRPGIALHPSNTKSPEEEVQVATIAASPSRKVTSIASANWQGNEQNPQEAWLPITESRNGNTFLVTFQILCSGIGMQALVLPVAFPALGW